MALGNKFCGEFTNMIEESNHIDLKSLFESMQRRMVVEPTDIRQAVDHNVALGDETEFAWLKFLEGVLPNRQSNASPPLASVKSS